MGNITLIISLGMIGFCIYIMFRNNWVFSLRQRANRDIYNSKKPKKLWALYDTVSYHSMMWRIFTSTKKIEKEFRKKIGLKPR